LRSITKDMDLTLSAVSVFDSENLGVKNALYFQAITDIEVERYGSAVIIRESQLFIDASY